VHKTEPIIQIYEHHYKFMSNIKMGLESIGTVVVECVVGIVGKVLGVYRKDKRESTYLYYYYHLRVCSSDVYWSLE